eukprot:NODE_823_length_1307_cov_275.337043_g624_i0.p1 GENE.NODE_823_length_1307_cov_275.337043_g624_i0~~NODE_823_length_1307_cov_275.337043_g624_i0.p1  ORF type:complete len:369 (+),score=84.06 NODE_823_length_1307_cov_275.337043_g624_i0:70-1176(+)
MASAPIDRVLVLGGCGFIGRHFVKFLVDNKLAAKVRIADKVLPEMAHLSPELKAAFDDPIVEFKQCSLTNKDHLPRAFTDEGGKFNIVVNLASDSNYGQSEEMYTNLIVNVRARAAAYAAEFGGVERYIEVSTAQVYEPKDKPAKETSKVKPWTQPATYQLQAEQQVLQHSGLPVIVVRLPIVYGPGDKGGIMPRAICASTYQRSEKRKMKMLWSGDLKTHTLHVTDAAASFRFVAKNGTPGEIYNVVDKTDTDQQKISKILDQIFGIDTSFGGSLLSSLAKLKLNDLANEANEGHMEEWAAMCKEHKIHSVLSPYVDKELLYNTPLSITGAKIEELGFQLTVPQLTKEAVMESIQYWIAEKQFPPIL